VIRHRISAAAFHIRNYITLCATLIALTGLCATAQAQDHHPLHRDFYMHWKQPGTNIGCCQARINHGWGETGDCEPTKAEVRNGQWHAWLRQESRWLPIPDGKIIRERNPNVFDAHLCWTPHQGVLCFVPPDTGG
jgi:hypothetical protein